MLKKRRKRNRMKRKEYRNFNNEYEKIRRKKGVGTRVVGRERERI